MMNAYFEYLHTLTTLPQPAPLAIVPKAAAQPVTTAITAILPKHSRAWVEPVKQGSLQKTKVRLWNDYKAGRKPTTGKFEVVAHFIRHMDTVEHELLAIRYPHEFGMLVRLRSTVCTDDEYAAWELALNPRTSERMAA